MKAFSDSRRQDEERARPFFLTDLQTTAPEEEKLAGNLSKKSSKKDCGKQEENEKVVSCALSFHFTKFMNSPGFV